MNNVLIISKPFSTSLLNEYFNACLIKIFKTSEKKYGYFYMQEKSFAKLHALGNLALKIYK